MRDTDYEILHLNKIIDKLLLENDQLKSDKNAIRDKIDEHIEHYEKEGHQATVRKMKYLKGDIEYEIRG